MGVVCVLHASNGTGLRIFRRISILIFSLTELCICCGLATQFYLENLKVRNFLGYVGLGGTIILVLILQK